MHLKATQQLTRCFIASQSADNRDLASIPPVVLYEHSDFRGSYVGLQTGDFGSLGDFKDKITSIKILPGFAATLCENENFDGRCFTVDQSTYRVPTLNDKIDSVKVFPFDPPARVYQHGDFKGDVLGVYEGQEIRHLNEFDFNDKISSIKVAAGYVLTLCEHPDFKGKCWSYENFEDDYTKAINDKISSLKVVPNEAPVSLYEHPNFAGQVVNLFNVGDAIADLADFNDKLSSIKVRRGYQVSVCSEKRFGGECVTLTDDNTRVVRSIYDRASSVKVDFFRNDIGFWDGPFEMPIVSATLANLPNGNVLGFAAASRDDSGGFGKTFTCTFNPITGECSEELVKNTGHNMFCPGTAVLDDQRILISGGSDDEVTTVYDPHTDSWTRGSDMNIPRGYHSTTVLPDGSVFAFGGSWNDGKRVQFLFFVINEGGKGKKDGEVFNIRTGQWENRRGIKSAGSFLTNDKEGLYRSDNHYWLFTAPDGRVFHAGPSKRMHWIETDGEGRSYESLLRGDDKDAMNGNSVMFDIGKILVVGGAENYNTGYGSKRAYVIDINGPEAVVTRVHDMIYQRVYPNTAVLPNGQVLVVGGKQDAGIFTDKDAIYAAEIFDPKTGRFTELASMKVPRTYHASGILLQDGRFFAAGGGICGDCGVNHFDGEIFTPPYLLNGDFSLRSRPEIMHAPTEVDVGEIFDVDVASVGDEGVVLSFALIRLSAATHSTNNDVRRIPLAASRRNASSYTISMPQSHAVAVPGTYWLFAMKSDDTPSVGYVISVKP